MTTKARDIMTRRVVTTSPAAQAVEVARLLSRHRISGVPVVEEGRLVGIISEVDLPGISPGEATVEELMTREVITVSPETPVVEIAGVMAQHGIKRVPVVEDDRLVGIISRADIVKWVAGGSR